MGVNLTELCLFTNDITMTAPIMFNGRLRKSDLKRWISLIESQTNFGCADSELATNFLKLPEAISFVSSVEDNIIGGTSIYRDRIRLGMVLASVAVKEEFRNTVAYNVIKSSLPFFKTVAIRDVDALIPDETSENQLGFPVSLELDSWTKDVLARIGFEEKDKLYNYVISIQGQKPESHTENMWDSQPDLENAKKLIWDCSKNIGMTNSFVWTGFDFAANQGTLRTVTIEDSMKLVTSIFHFGKHAYIGLIISDDEFADDGIASRLIAKMVREFDVENLTLPLIGKGQSNLVKAVTDELGGSLKRRSMTLMRKPL